MSTDGRTSGLHGKRTDKRAFILVVLAYIAAAAADTDAVQ